MKTSIRSNDVSLATVLGLLLAVPAAQALTFNLTYDASVSNAPAGFVTCFQAAIAFYEGTYSDPITINLDVGWGEIDGHSLSPGDLGQSSTFQQGSFSYSQIRTALVNDAKSADDATAIASLPTTDPMGGASFVMANAEAKALGLLAGDASGLDGYVGFNSSAVYTFDPNNRAVSGKYDFFGLASHEITEIMGRYGLGQNGASSGRYSPIDLFRYSAPGVRDLIPTNGDYLSTTGGTNLINTFNGTGGGDLSDWAGATFDSYDAFLTEGEQMNISPGDITEMDVIGYDLAVPPPLLAIGTNGPNGLLLSWSTLSTQYVVQTNLDLTATNWHSANYAVTVVDRTNYSARIAPPFAPGLFFRLKQ